MLRGLSLTPFAVAAREGYRPALDLDFTSPAEVLDPRITYSGGANATRVNSAGLLVASSGVPRFDYAPSTLAPLGLLVEEARTNVCSNSGLTVASTGVTVAQNATHMTGAANTAYTVTDDGATSAHFATTGNGASYVSGQATAVTAYIQAGTATRAQVTVTTGGGVGTTTTYVNFGLTGAGSVLAAGAGASGAIRVYAPGVYACTMIFTPGATLGTSPAIIGFINSDTATRLPSFSGSGLTFVVHGSQIEAGSFATSYIPTTSAAVTRSADIATMSGAAAMAWFRQGAGTMLADVRSSAVSGQFPNAAYLSDGTGLNRIFVYLVPGASTSVIGGRVDNGGANQFNTSTGGPLVSNGGAIRGAFAWSRNNMSMVHNGGDAINDSDMDPPLALTRLDIGVSYVPNNWLNGHIRRIRYWRQRLPDSVLRNLTA